MYKIAVYAICKNEIEELNDWMKSMAEADYICVLDTGSTDGTYEALLEYQKKNPNRYRISQKIYDFWRFDVARNDSLKLIPEDADICVCVDLDERLIPTWSDLLQGAWFDGCEACYYLYAHDHTKDGQPTRTIWYGKIHGHSPKWFWRFPLHEEVTHRDYVGQQLPPTKSCLLSDTIILLHHYQKRRPNRSIYLPLLKLRYEENKNDLMSALYLAHEFFYQHEFQNSIDFILNVLLPNFDLTDSIVEASTYWFLGNDYCFLQQFDKGKEAFKKGIEIEPTYRDNYLGLARCYMDSQQYDDVIDTIQECFHKTRHYLSWLEQPNSWSWDPWDMLAAAYYQIHAIDMAFICGQIALQFNPQDQRLQDNVKLLQELIKQ